MTDSTYMGADPDKVDDVARLRAEVAALRKAVAARDEALRPIVEAADWFFDGITDNQIICAGLNVGHLRTARRVLEGGV